MDITLKLPDSVLLRPKTIEEVARDARQALAELWLRQGAVDVNGAARVAYEGMDFNEFLMAMPDPGDDSVFERQAEPPGREVEWDT